MSEHKGMDTETLIDMAKLAEQAERYEDMVKYMKEVIEMKGEDGLSQEERNFFSVAYKNVVGARRSAWRIVSSLESKQLEKGNPSEEEKEYRKTIEDELHEKCNEVLAIIGDYLATRENKPAPDGEELVFFYKMKGDYIRYLVEVMVDGNQKTEKEELSLQAYEKATKIAEEKLPPTHPIRLGLALNFSVFYYEIKGKTEKACELAKMAFDSAIAELEQMQEDSYKDSTLIMQLLRDNLTLWTSENEREEEEN